MGALERGDRRFPHPDTVERLADALGLDTTQRHEFVAAAARPRAPHDSARILTAPWTCHRLPPRVARFTGREEQVDSLTRLLTDGSGVPVVAITGMGGVGKTTLAVHVGYQVAHRFPDGQLFLDLGGRNAPLLVAEALELLLWAIGVADDAVTTDVAEIAARVAGCNLVTTFTQWAMTHGLTARDPSPPSRVIMSVNVNLDGHRISVRG